MKDDFRFVGICIVVLFFCGIIIVGVVLDLVKVRYIHEQRIQQLEERIEHLKKWNTSTNDFTGCAEVVAVDVPLESLPNSCTNVTTESSDSQFDSQRRDKLK